MKLFKTVDEELRAIGFVKIDEDKHGATFERYNKVLNYTQVVSIMYKEFGNHIIQSYDKNLMDDKKIGNCCLVLTYREMILFLKKFSKIKRKYRWKSSLRSLRNF